MTLTAPHPARLDLPRDQWAEHPHWPAQTLLLGAHDHFRHTSQTLLRRASQGGDIAGIGWVFSYWKLAMSGHERYEEGKLYPYLEARWGLSCAALEDGHQALAQVDRRVRAAVDAEDREALVTALTEHDRVLIAHLDAEERTVIPALLALSPEEFADYYNGDITTLLASLPALP